jgi:hypothetical protein
MDEDIGAGEEKAARWLSKTWRETATMRPGYASKS